MLLVSDVVSPSYKATSIHSWGLLMTLSSPNYLANVPPVNIIDCFYLLKSFYPLKTLQCGLKFNTVFGRDKIYSNHSIPEVFAIMLSGRKSNLVDKGMMHLSHTLETKYKPLLSNKIKS